MPFPGVSMWLCDRTISIVFADRTADGMTHRSADCDLVASSAGSEWRPRRPLMAERSTSGERPHGLAYRASPSAATAPCFRLRRVRFGAELRRPRAGRPGRVGVTL